ncbi:MAG: NADH-quinone oxidoreductase subunit NuoN [Bacteroidetes bacterium]|nr:NADH-quinone oxidoreductase subunit NuoN [Bacteroidota bacterium]
MNLYLIAPEISIVCLGLLVLVLDLVPNGGRRASAGAGKGGLAGMALVALMAPASLLMGLVGRTQASYAGALVQERPEAEALVIEDKKWLGYLALVGLVVPAWLLAGLIGWNQVGFSGTFVQDPLALFFKAMFLLAAALVVLSSMEYVRKLRLPAGEYYALVLFATSGLMLMVSARELITIYISLELATISFILLAGFNRADAKSSEAGLKYILLNAVASATLLYGMAIVYGLTGSTYLDGIAKGLNEISPAALMGLVLLVGGLGFKIAAVPFHMWVPDVYEGAPTPITAFLSVGSKAAGFALVVRVFTLAFGGPAHTVWPGLFAVLAALTMTLGNVVAMRQDNVKRLLAYSSITQAGYAMMGLAAATSASTAALSFFLLAYTFTNLGAFIAIIAFFNQIGSDDIEAYRGLARRAPLLSLVLALCLLSLAGIPPMVGFASKVYLFWSVFDAGLVWLVIVGLLNSAASIYYYLRVVRTMYLGEPSAEGGLAVGPAARVAMLAAVAGVLVIGVMPWPLIQLAGAAAASLFP